MQLDFNDPLLQLSSAIPWHDFEQAFSVHYSVSVATWRAKQADSPDDWVVSVETTREFER